MEVFLPTMSLNTNLLFENYEEYVTNEENDLQNPQSAVRLLREDAQFNDFTDTLVEGLDADASYAVKNVLDQQRTQLLTEGANVGPSVFTHK